MKTEFPDEHDGEDDDDTELSGRAAAGGGVSWPITDVAQTKRFAGSVEERYAAVRQFCVTYLEAMEQCVAQALRKYGSRDPARDLTNDFVIRLLDAERPGLAGYKAEQGRLRHYVGRMLQNFVVSRFRHDAAETRGGKAVQVEWTDDAAPVEPPLTTPFDLRVAHDILGRIGATLEAEWSAKGKAEELRILLPAVVNAGDKILSQELADQLGVADNSARDQKHKLAMRFRALLEAEVRAICLRPEDLEDEQRWVVQAWAVEE